MITNALETYEYGNFGTLEVVNASLTAVDPAPSNNPSRFTRIGI